MNLYTKRFIQFIKEAKNFVVAGILLFVTGVLFGVFNDNLHTMLDGQLEAVRELALRVKESSNPKLQLFIVILFNNVLKALLIIVLGALLSVIPIFFLLINGAVLGYLFVLRSEELGAGKALGELAKGILPHGIIEIPAIILAAAFGIKLGSYVYRWLGLVVAGKSRQILRQEWKEHALGLPLMGAGISVLLLVAAIIESTVTPWILSL
ncbi:stage II sporulation protein M [Paenibacillaceae bacterium GAS479]|nr:stage II sporulation protein M [Paenibacillaceae bacterium GAS479]